MPLATGTKTLDNMMGGGIPLGVPSLIFGKFDLVNEIIAVFLLEIP